MTYSEITAELTDKLSAGLAGDSEAYADFLSGLSPILRKVIGRKIPAGDVEDVLQETLISIHKARHTYDGERPLIPWVNAIAAFRITDYLRKAYSNMRYRTVDIADYENMAEVVTEAVHDNESINQMLNGVGRRERQILSLMHMEGYTAREVGTRLGLKESAVKVAAHRAVKKIRERFRSG